MLMNICLCIYVFYALLYTLGADSGCGGIHYEWVFIMIHWPGYWCHNDAYYMKSVFKSK